MVRLYGFCLSITYIAYWRHPSIVKRVYWLSDNGGKKHYHCDGLYYCSNYSTCCTGFKFKPSVTVSPRKQFVCTTHHAHDACMYTHMLELHLENLSTGIFPFATDFTHTPFRTLHVCTYQSLEGEGDLLEKVQHGVDHLPTPQQVREPGSIAAVRTNSIIPHNLLFLWLVAS